MSERPHQKTIEKQNKQKVAQKQKASTMPKVLKQQKMLNPTVLHSANMADLQRTVGNQQVTQLAQQKMLNPTMLHSTNMAHLQRTIGNQRVKQLVQHKMQNGGMQRHYSSIIQRIHTEGNLDNLGQSDDNLPVAIGNHLDNEEEGQAIMSRLARGDRTALADIGVQAPEDYPLQSHEWGLGFDNDVGQYVIVRGGPGAVNWSLLENVDGISHSHPLPDNPTLPEGLEEILGDDTPSILDLINLTDLVGIDGAFGGQYNSCFPSNQDLSANYTTGAGNEMLHTPYRLNANNEFSNGADDPLVSVSFGPVSATLRDNPQGNIDEANMIANFYAPIILFKGNVELWQGIMRANPDGVNAALSQEPIGDNARTRQENQQILAAPQQPENQQQWVPPVQQGNQPLAQFPMGQHRANQPQIPVQQGNQQQWVPPVQQGNQPLAQFPMGQHRANQPQDQIEE